MAELTRTCTVPRAQTVFMVPGQRRMALNGPQGQDMLLQQLNQSHHELRRYATGHPSDNAMYCVFCGAVENQEVWQALLSAPVEASQ